MRYPDVERYPDEEGVREDAMRAVYEGRSLVLAPAASLRSEFSSHVNWPKQILDRYDVGCDHGSPFVIPFLVPLPAPKPQPLAASFKSPAGDMEVHGVERFDETNPEHLLARFEELGKRLRREGGGSLWTRLLRGRSWR